MLLDDVSGIWRRAASAATAGTVDYEGREIAVKRGDLYFGICDGFSGRCEDARNVAGLADADIH